MTDPTAADRSAADRPHSAGRRTAWLALRVLLAQAAALLALWLLQSTFGHP